ARVAARPRARRPPRWSDSSSGRRRSSEARTPPSIARRGRSTPRRGRGIARRWTSSARRSSSSSDAPSRAGDLACSRTGDPPTPSRGRDDARARPGRRGGADRWPPPARRLRRCSQDRRVGPGDAWAAVVSERSHFRPAARGAAAALPFLLSALSLSLLAAAFAAVLARARDMFPGRSRDIALAAATAALCALLSYPLLP